MYKKMKIKSILFATTVALLASCGSSKKVVDETPNISVNTPASTTNKQNTTKNETDKKPATTVTKQTEPVITVEKFTADLDIALTMGSDHYDLGGKISMKRDKVVRMNLTFMGFIEVGIIEFTPDQILIVNRIGKEYTKAKYNDIEALRKNGITFKKVETMAWEKLYAKDGKKIKDSELDKTIENLINSNMKNGKKATVHIEVGKPNTTKDFDTYTTVKSSYREVPADMLMASLMNFAK